MTDGSRGEIDVSVLEALGVTKADLLERVVDAIATRAMSGTSFDFDLEDEDYLGDARVAMKRKFSAALNSRIKNEIKKAVDRLADEVVTKRIEELVASVVLTKTNEWGEKRGAPITFTEYLVERANVYMTEKVRYDGKPPDHYNRDSATQTRLAHVIDNHLHNDIAAAVKTIVSDGTKQLGVAVSETVKLKLGEIMQKIKVDVRT